jgi:hypothetical protein
MVKPEENDFDTEVDAVKSVLKALGNLSDIGKQWVLKSVSERLGLQAPTPGGTSSGAPFEGTVSSSGPSVKSLTAKQFLAAKKPANDVEQIACLGFYLTNNKNQPHFNTLDLTKLNTEAAGRPFGNAARSVNNATARNGFLTPAGKGKKQITALGEEFVNALPDRAAVKKVIDNAPIKRRGKAKGGKARGASTDDK